MKIKDDATAVLRNLLGEGFERADYNSLRDEFVRRQLHPHLIARAKGGINRDRLVQARENADAALATETESVASLELAAVSKVGADLAGLS